MVSQWEKMPRSGKGSARACVPFHILERGLVSFGEVARGVPFSARKLQMEKVFFCDFALAIVNAVHCATTQSEALNSLDGDANIKC